MSSKRRRQKRTKRPSSRPAPAWSDVDWRLLVVLAGFVAYGAWFYTAEMPSLTAATGQTFLRAELLSFLSAAGDVAAQWFDGPLGILDRVPLLLGAVGLHAIAAAVGWWLIRLVRAETGLTRIERCVFSVAVGLQAISLYTLFVGLAGGPRFGAWSFVPLLLCGTVGGLAVVTGPLRQASRRRYKKPERVRPRDTEKLSSLDRRGSWAVGWCWLAAPFVLVIVWGGMLPPVDFDVREYHLQAPKEFFQQGHTGYLPHNAYANMPLGSQMLSLLAMATTGDWRIGGLLGKTATALVTPWTALGLLAAGRRFFSTTCGAVAAVVYLSIPWIVRTTTAGLVEGVSAHFLFLAVYAVLIFNATSTNRLGVSLLAGLMAGSAVAVKYPAALFVLLPLSIWMAVLALRRAKLQSNDSSDNQHADETARSSTATGSWRYVVMFLLAATVTCGPWFAKNWILTGNPTYPLLARVFPDATQTRTTALIDRWEAAHRPESFTPADFVRRLADVLGRSPWHSPLLIPLAGLALARGRARRWALPLLAYLAFVLLAWWLFTHRIDRFWLPALPVVALLAGVGADWSRSRTWRYMLVVLLLFGLSANLLTVTLRTPGNDNRYFVTLDALRVDPLRVDAWHLRLNRLYAEREAAARPMKVLSVGDAQVFDLQMPVLYNTVFDPSWLEILVKDRAADEIRDEFRRRGITHVFVHWGEIARYRSPGNYGFSEFVQPEVFEKLVADRILLPPLHQPDHPGEVYLVR